MTQNQTSTPSGTSSQTSGTALLVLEDGRIFRGRSYGAVGTALGEAVFATGMTGYQETITDPSYARQLVVQTAPHIGNTGVNDEDAESRRIWVAGYIVRDAARRPSNWRSERSLDEELVDQGIVGIQGVDTRAITRHLRERGAMKAGIFSGDAAGRPGRTASTRSRPGADGRLPAGRGGQHRRGLRRRARGPRLGRRAALHHCRPRPGHQVHDPAALRRARRARARAAGHRHPPGRAGGPARTASSCPTAPGDPATADAQVGLLRKVLDTKVPFFGICFGNQILGRALGFGTYKLRYGHRGINQPVMDRRTGKVEITSQNHGFAVDAPLDGPTHGPGGALRPGRGQPREPERRRRRGPRPAWTSRPSPSSTTPRRPPARTTRPTCSTGSST